MSSEGTGFALEAVATPGHTANHLAFALAGAEDQFRWRSCDGLVDPRSSRRRTDR